MIGAALVQPVYMLSDVLRRDARRRGRKIRDTLCAFDS